MSHPRFAICFLAALLFECRGIAGDDTTPNGWPHLRGPNCNGISPEKDLVEAWPESGPPVLWSRELGQGYSGFVAVDDRVFTQFQTRTGQYVVSLDADSGAEVWRQRVDWPWHPAGAFPGPYSTPTWHAGRIYYSTPTGLVGCLDSSDGRSLWSVDTHKRFQGKGTDFGYAATPLVEDGLVIFPVGGPGASVVALNAEDGSTAWAVGDDQASYCPVTPITFRGRRLAVAYLRNSLVAHELTTGEQIWRVELSSDYDEHSAWPLYSEPYLLIAAPFRVGSRLYRLDETEAKGAPRLVWSNRALSNDVCSSVLVGGQVYGFDLHQLQASAHRPSRGLFKCLDFETGKVRWETDKVGHATVLVADGKLIFLNDLGTLILAKENHEAYEELARVRVLDGGLCWTPPTLYRGKLFMRNHSKAVCVYLGPPEKLDPNRAPASLPRGIDTDWSVLLTREPEYPHDPPTASEVFRWFGWCIVGVFGGAGAISGAVWLTARMANSARPGFWAGSAFAVAAFILGLMGTTVFSAWADAFVLTWPASLYVVFRLTLAMTVWVEGKAKESRPRLMPRLVMLLFLFCCYGYYWLCLQVGYVMAWAFLAGFVPAAPVAILAARSPRRWLQALADVMSFAIYFWMSGMLTGWKGRWIG